MRTINFRRRKDEIIRNLDATTALEMKDYSGKLEARKSKQGTSENLGTKLSNHGSIFVFRNPTKDIRERHPSTDWTQFPAASEDVYLQVNCFVATDDSKQSAYHMGCVMEISYKKLKESFPWLENVIPYSDQCGDYHSTGATIFNHAIGRLTGIHVVRSEHSEVGEGKGEVDMKFGILAQQFYSTLAKSNRECAQHLFDQLEEVRRPGDFNVHGEIDRSHFKSGTSGAIPLHDQCQCIVHHKDGGITLHEMYGIGSGKHYSEEDLKKFDHYGMMAATTGTGSRALQTTAGTMVPVPRESREVKREAKKAKTARQKEQQKKGEKQVEEDATAKEKAVETHMGVSQAERQQLTCPACSGQYLTQNRFDRHVSRGLCAQRKAAAAAKLSQAKSARLEAEKLMKERREQRDQDEQEEMEQLSTVEVELADGADAAAIVLEVARESGGVVVKSVNPLRRRVALVVLQGYCLNSIESDGITTVSAARVMQDGGGGGGGGGGDGSNDDTVLSEARAALAQVSATNHVKVKFSKPPPAMPPHGWARKNLRVSPNTQVTPTQKQWLEKFCDVYEKKGSPPRHPVVYQAMVNYRGLLYVADNVPFVMSETAIFNWLKRRWATQKAAGINLALAAATAPTNAAATVATEDGGDEVDYMSMNVASLRVLLRNRQLETNGRKGELVARLAKDDTEGNRSAGHF